MFSLKIKTTKLEQKVIIPATPEEVYDAYMDAKKHAKFTGAKATIDPTVGGKFTAWDGYITGKNLELIKGKKIVQEWVTTEWPQDYPPSRFELTFNKTKEGTEILVVHSNIPAEQKKELEEGWTEWYWEPLKKYFEKQKPKTKKPTKK
jgi:uncharacterized protein YndB with AHSA1/START domain